ncbi:MAG: hypothetical protein HY434_02270 [Candidatus Liptonbacteria bacterium]|nr:hypothetical protein [Candidatus Liptonbacteria bacterium]
MLPKKILILLVAAVVVILAFGIWLGSLILREKKINPAGSSQYSAVYLTTGDIYFGKLSWFPYPRLKNVWFLQRSVGQNNQVQLGIGQFNNAFWSPVDEVRLNPKQIILWATLRNDSQVIKVFDNPSLLQQSSPSADGSAPQISPSTSTFSGPSGQPPSRN